MKFLAAGLIVILLVFFGINYLMQQAPTPNPAAIQFALDKYINFTPMKWDFEIGKTATTKDGIEARTVIYHILTSEGSQKKEVELRLLFYKVDDEWKTEKVE